LNGFGNPFTAADERIETYLDMQTIGRMLEDCNVAVTTKEPKEKTASLLRESLNASSEVYAYNVSPRNLSRRVAASISARRALQAAIGAQGSSGPAEASANVGGGRTRAEHREELELEPFIVPFARSRNAPSGKTPYATDFGWAVAPRRNDDGAKFEDGQHALAAVVSMPGWWRSAELSVTTCWVPRTALKQLANTATGGRAKAAGPTITVSPQVKDFCEAGQSASVQTELIRLPGTIQEVSRKLGFEVVQEPNLDDVQLFPQVLQVGYGGEVLLTGGRLWRSTEVTLGSQAADRIAVLPNMRGIIATFDCVRPQLPWGAPAGTRQDVEVKVWTSEGVVRHPDMVKLEYPEGRQLRGAKACPLETRLDRSQIAPGSSQPPPQNSPAASPQNPTPSSTQVPQQGLPLANSPPPSPQPTSRPQQPLPDPGPSAGR
jgi:hypothetical protein